MRWSNTIATLIAATSLAGAGAALAAPPNKTATSTLGTAPATAAPDSTAATPTAPVPVQSAEMPMKGAAAPTATAQAPAGPAPVETAQAPTTTPDPAAPAPAATAETAPAPAAPAADANAPTQVVAFVNTQFPTADTNGDGELSSAEFQAWMGKLKEAELKQAGKPVVQAEVTTYTSNAFARADADKNNQVTRTELTQFLQG